MRVLACVICMLMVWSCPSWAVELKANLDPVETVRRINASYNRIDNQCKESDTGAARGHYYCSGITLRMVNDGNFNPWDYSPYALQTGATSYTWIRRDLSTTVLVHPAGFILRTPTDGLALQLPVKQEGWTCIYTFDGYTGPDRKWYGCGPFNDATFVPPAQPTTVNKNAQWAYGTCADQNVNTAEQWKQKYQGGARQPIQTTQCSWNAEVPAQWDAMIQAHEARVTTTNADPYSRKDFFNEFMLKNAAGGSDIMDDIDAFIYQGKSAFNYPVRGDNGKAAVQQDGLANARTFQRKLYGQGYAVPILNVDFTRPPEQRFTYSAADQGISLNLSRNVTAKYIARSNWEQRLDPGTGKTEWTLNVVLTELGKKVQASQQQEVYQELYDLRGSDPQWRNEERYIGSMKQQIACIVRNYPQRADWNLEPFRPVVSEAAAKAAGCNPFKK